MFTAKFNDGRLFSSPTSKVVCVGRNYAEHAKELNNPVPSSPILFIKPETSLVDLESPFKIPASDCHYELEVAVLIGREISNTPVDQVKVAIAGFGLALDLTRRELQSRLKEKSHPWEVAKCFDGACPVSSFLPASQISDLNKIEFSLSIDGELKQKGHSGDMLTPILPLIAHMSQFFTLREGDIVLTGTPKGVGALSGGEHLALVLASELSFKTSVITGS